MASTTYVAAWDLVLVRRKNDLLEYVYKGAPAPEDAVDGELERLAEEGALVRQGGSEDPAKPAPKPIGR